MEQKQVVSPDLQETTEETTHSTEDVDIEELKAKAARTDEVEGANKQLFERAKKAESKLKEFESKQTGKTDVKPDELSTKDLYALMQHQVAEDDVDEVVKAAKLLGKTVPEALKDETVQSILSRRVEVRKTANATNTNTARPSSKKMSDADILARAERGEIPEPGTPEAEQLWRARRGIKS